MREIKFKGKRKDNGEWIVGNLFIPNKLVGGIWICPETTYGDFYPGLMDGDDLKDYEFGGISLGHFHEVIPETVGEYTGLKDKNGKEIYEGDILEFADKWEWYKGKYGIAMSFANEERRAKLQAEYDAEPMERREVEIPSDYEWLLSYEIQSYWQVVGNVSENPELLQK